MKKPRHAVFSFCGDEKARGAFVRELNAGAGTHTHRWSGEDGARGGAQTKFCGSEILVAGDSSPISVASGYEAKDLVTRDRFSP